MSRDSFSTLLHLDSAKISTRPLEEERAIASPQQVRLWTAHAGSIIAIALVEEVAAFVQIVDLG